MASGTQVKSIEENEEQSPFEKDKQIKKIPTPLEGVDHQKAESFEDPNQKGSLKDDVEKSIVDEGLDLSTEIEPMEESPLMVEMKLRAAIQIWSSFVFQSSIERGEVWVSNTTVNLWSVSNALKYFVGLKHRWRWKFPWWKPPWVLRTGPPATITEGQGNWKWNSVSPLRKHAGKQAFCLALQKWKALCSS
jgi:hypothetical protein